MSNLWFDSFSVHQTPAFAPREAVRSGGAPSVHRGSGAWRRPSQVQLQRSSERHEVEVLPVARGSLVQVERAGAFSGGGGTGEFGSGAVSEEEWQ